MDGTTKHEYKVLNEQGNGQMQRTLTASDRKRTKEKREMIKTPYKIKTKAYTDGKNCSVKARGDFNNEQRKIIHSKLLFFC